MLLSSDLKLAENVLLRLTLKRAFIVLLATGLTLNFLLMWRDWDELKLGYADFTIFYSAAKIVRSGRGADLYSEQAQWLAQMEYAPGVSIRHGALPYNHPPFEALLFVQFTFVPYFSAYLAWGATNLAMLGIVIWMIRRQSERLRNVPAWILFLAALSFFPVFMCLFQGQDVVLLLLLVTGAYVFLKSDSDFEAGVALGLGVFRPQLGLPLAMLVLCMRKTKRLAMGFVVSTVAMAAMSIAAVGWQSLIAYPSYVCRIERALGNGAIVPGNMPNLRGLFSLLHESNLSAFVMTGLSSIPLFVFGAWILGRNGRRLNLKLSFVFSVLVSLLVSYHLLIYDLALLFLPMVFMYEEWEAISERSRARGRAVLGPPVFLFCTPLLMWLWLGLGHFNVVAIVLLVWLSAVAPLVSRETVHRNEILVRAS